MIVVSLVNPPRSLHGDLSKWLQEVNTNVYVGNVNARVRDALWDRITESIKTGQATMVFTTNNEQGMDVRVWGTTWEPTDFDGLILMRKPFPKQIVTTSADTTYIGNSKYSKYRKFGKSENLAPISSTLFAVIDIETTGLDFRTDDIIEIGFILADSKSIYEKRAYLIKTSHPISCEVEKLTSITNATLEKEGISLEEALKHLADSTDHLSTIFHNASFDLRFLTAAFKKVGIKPPVWKIQDTMALAKKALPGLNSYSLQTICEELQCPTSPSHRALTDCTATWEAYAKLINLGSSS